MEQGEMVIPRLLGVEVVPCDTVGTDLLQAPWVAVTPNLLWDLWGCYMSP